MIINWKEKRVLIVPIMKDGVRLRTESLIYGYNNLKVKNADEEKAVRETLQKKIELGSVEIIDIEKTVEVPKDPKDKSKGTKKQKVKKGGDSVADIEDANKARKIVENTYNVKTLEDWLHTEERKEIRTLIQNQIDDVKNYKKEQETE